MLILEIAVLWIVVIPAVTVVGLLLANRILGQRSAGRSALAARFLAGPAGGDRPRVAMWTRARGCDAEGRRGRILTHR